MSNWKSSAAGAMWFIRFTSSFLYLCCFGRRTALLRCRRGSWIDLLANLILSSFRLYPGAIRFRPHGIHDSMLTPPTSGCAVRSAPSLARRHLEGMFRGEITGSFSAAERWSPLGHSRHFNHVRGESAPPPIATKFAPQRPEGLCDLSNRQPLPLLGVFDHVAGAKHLSPQVRRSVTVGV
jgi:hypothetical protein